MKVRYRIPIDGDPVKRSLKIRETCRNAIGTRDPNSPTGYTGTSNNPKRLFTVLTATVGGRKNLLEYLQYKDIPGIEDKVLKVISDKGWGIKIPPLPEVSYETIIVRIHPKSDPVGQAAGNFVPCCMGFGTGKSNVYHFNTTLAQMTVQIGESESNRKFGMQSIVGETIDTGKSIPQIISEISKEDSNLSDVLPEEVLTDSEHYLTPDNLEVHGNHKESEYWSMIYRNVCHDFLGRYLAYCGVEQGMSPSLIPIGQNYTGITGLSDIDNTFAPVAPPGYSDNTGKRAYFIDPTLALDAETSDWQIEVLQMPEPITLEEQLARNISTATPSDALRLGYIEGKAFEGSSLLQGLHNIENTLIATAINNEAKDRPNMSLKYISDDNKVTAYLIAYEGKAYSGKGDSHDHARFGLQPGEDMIYVADVAALSDTSHAGIKLLRAFAKRYANEYLAKGQALPIYAHLRDSTSYKILLREGGLLERLAKEHGIEFDIEQREIKKDGEILHAVCIRPKDAAEALVA